MRARFVRSLLLGVCLLPCSIQGAFAQKAWAGDEAVVELNVNVGFDGVAVPGWAPVAVEVRNRGADVAGRLVARARGGSQEVLFEASRDVVISGRAPRRYWLYVYTSESVKDVEVALLDVAGEPLAAPIASRVFYMERRSSSGSIVPDGLRILVVGQDSSQFTVAMGRRNRQHDWLSSIEWEDLPDRAIGYSSLDVVVCLGRGASSSLSPGQAQGLVDWARAGGQVVLAPPLDAAWFSGSLQKALLPGLETVGLVEIPGFAGLSRRYQEFPAGPGSVLEVRWPGAQVVLSETLSQRRVSLLQRRLLGNGAVWLLSCDLMRPPFSSWRRVRALVADHVVAPIRSSRLGGNALAWQRGEEGSVRDQVVNRRLQRAFESGLGGSLTLIICLLTVYLVLVGPVNQVVLRRYHAEVWSSLTIPALSLVSAVAILGAVYLTKGISRVVRRVTVLELRLGEQHAWETTVLAVTGSGRSSMDVDMHPRLVGLPVFWDRDQARRVGIKMTQGDAFSLVDYPVANWQPGIVLGQGIRDLAGAVDVIESGEGFSLVNGSEFSVIGGVFNDGGGLWSVSACGPGEQVTLEPWTMLRGPSLGRSSLIKTGGRAVSDALLDPGASPEDRSRDRDLVLEVIRGIGIGRSLLDLVGEGPRLWLRVIGVKPRMSVRGGGRLESDVQILYGHQDPYCHR